MASMCIDLSKMHWHRSQNQLSLNPYRILKYHANHKSVLNAQKSSELNIIIVMLHYNLGTDNKIG